MSGFARKEIIFLSAKAEAAHLFVDLPPTYFFRRLSKQKEWTRAVLSRAQFLFLDAKGLDSDFWPLLKDLKQWNLLSRVAVVPFSEHKQEEILRAGVEWILSPPFSRSKFASILRGIEKRNSMGSIVGYSLQMQKVFETLEQITTSRSPIFLTGESGVGKDLVAQEIHRSSSRRDREFVALNCAAIPKELLESELFGHVKGAFTGACSHRLGAVRKAEGGTLFLDEICEMPLELQARLLRFLQDGCVRPVGGDDELSVDVRIVAATNRDPLAEVQAKRFRKDLFYRLYVVPIFVPALRDRKEDILPLARLFLERSSKEEGKSFRSLALSVESLFLECAWPGNVRELRNVIHGAVALHDGEVLERNMLPLLPEVPDLILDEGMREPKFIRSLWEIEREAIEQAIAFYRGNIQQAAQHLEISSSKIYRKRRSWASRKDNPLRGDA